MSASHAPSLIASIGADGRRYLSQSSGAGAESSFFPQQAMNTSFDRLHLVNTYGAFGTVGRQRFEIIFEGTLDAEPTESGNWLPYEFKVKPGDPKRRPAIITPYHHRLDWQIWFAAMAAPE
jgi:hypothetical protein